MRRNRWWIGEPPPPPTPLDDLVRRIYEEPVLTPLDPPRRYSRTRRVLAWIMLLLIAALVAVCWYLGGV